MVLGGVYGDAMVSDYLLLMDDAEVNGTVINEEG